MRPRAGTHPVTLEPSEVLELLALARQHDERLKDIRQDLFRAETKLQHEVAWRWPIRAAFLTAGIVGVIAWQNDGVREAFAAFIEGTFVQIRRSGVETLVTLAVAGLMITGLVYLIRRWLRGPTPEQRARKLMEQFARADGVAAYVFSPDDTPEDEANLVAALTRPENKRMRRRRLTQDNRPLTSSMTRILNQKVDDVGMARGAASPNRLADRRPIIHREGA